MKKDSHAGMPDQAAVMRDMAFLCQHLVFLYTSEVVHICCQSVYLSDPLMKEDPQPVQRTVLCDMACSRQHPVLLCTSGPTRGNDCDCSGLLQHKH